MLCDPGVCGGSGFFYRFAYLSLKISPQVNYLYLQCEISLDHKDKPCESRGYDEKDRGEILVC